MTSTESNFETTAASIDPFLSNDFYPLNQANASILSSLRKDESDPNADLYRRIASSNTSSSYNSEAHSYTSHNGSSNGPDIHHTMQYQQSIPLPPYLTNIVKETKLSSLMGILPEGDMVWVSVDDSLYIWEYGSVEKGRKKEDFVCFTVPTGQCIVSVGIVRPKPGMFINIYSWRFILKSFISLSITSRCFQRYCRMVSCSHHTGRSHYLCSCTGKYQ